MRRPARCRSAIGTARNATASRSPRRWTRSPTPSRGGSTLRRPQSSMTEDASRFAGEPEAFGRLWTPHRMVYIRGEGKPTHDDAGEDCPFCAAPSRSDEDALIVARGDKVYAVLNLYPYNSGHLMSVPYRHVADYPDL